MSCIQGRPQPLPPFDLQRLLDDPPTLTRRLVLAFALERPKLLPPPLRRRARQQEPTREKTPGSAGEGRERGQS